MPPIVKQLALRGNLPALAHDGGALTYAELSEKVRTLADRLTAAGGGAGTPVALIAGPETIDAVIVALAAASIDALYISIPASLGRGGIEHVMAEAPPKLLFVAANDAPFDVGRFAVAPASTVAQMPLPNLRPTDGIERAPGGTIVVTSGTEALPKLVFHTWASRFALAHGAARAFGFAPGVTALGMTDIARPFGLIVFGLAALLAGAALRLCAHRTPECLPELCRGSDAAVAAIAPHAAAAFAHQAEGSASARSGLRMIVIPGATVPASARKALRRQFGVPAIGLYGLSETGTVAREIAGDEPREGFHGVLLDGVTARTGASDDGLPEIELRSPYMMEGYWAAGGIARIGRDGWYRTGDRGTLGAERTLHIDGRVKDIILVGGSNVSPARIEHLMLSLAGIAECAAVHAADPIWGEVPVAFAVLRNGTDIAALQAVSMAGFGDREWPRLLVAVASLPLNSNGKIDRLALAARAKTLRQALAPGVPIVAPLVIDERNAR